MNTLMPDEVLSPQPISGWGAVSNLDDAALQQQIARYHKKKLFPLFALGFAGGALGSRLIRANTGGLVLAAGVAVWALWMLRKD